jgi:hypothetical protein
MTKEKASDHYSFVSGYVQDNDTIRVIAQIDQLNELDEPNSILMKYVRSEDNWYAFDIDWYAIRLLVYKKQLFAVGPQGEILVATAKSEDIEEIDSSNNGPSQHGEIRDLRLIDNKIYVTGMGRQVYRREGKNKWTRRDSGILQAIDTEEVTGLNSIDGLNEDDIYAVGYKGEICHFRKRKWQLIESPTNVILNYVCVVNKELVFVCGQLGTLLRGYYDSWESIEHECTDEQFWAMAWFNDELFVTTDNKIYKLLPDDTLEAVDMNLGYEATCGYLHASSGILLSVGIKHICWTADGVKWHDQTD